MLADEVTNQDVWEQLIDRVDAALEWVMSSIYKGYEAAGALDDSTDPIG